MVQGSLQNTTVCVVGLGYVGYPLADAFSRHLRTIGYDLDAKKIARIISWVKGRSNRRAQWVLGGE